MNNRLRNILLGIGVSLFSFLPGYAADTPEVLTDSDVLTASRASTDDEISIVEINKVNIDENISEEKEEKEERESLFPKATRNLDNSHFTWGAEFGASIDLSGYNTSTFNVDAVLGYKNNYFRILGAGVGIHRSLGNGDNFIPVYALLRSSFSHRPRLFFMSLKVGYSFNTIGDSPTFGDTNAQLGAGINLAMGKKFQSHIILAYEFRHFNRRHKYILNDKANDISLATISFGVNF